MEIHEFAADSQKLRCILGCVNAFTPRANDSRSHDALNVGFGCEMPSKGMTLVFVHAVLKQRTEDRRIDLRPIFGRRAVLPSHQPQFEACQLDWFDFREESPIEIANSFEAAATRGRRAVHLPE